MQFRAEKEVLCALGISERSTKSYDILSLHGAGESTKERSLYLLREIVSQTHKSALTFDFSGNGNSTGQLRQSSLNKRLSEALCASKIFCVSSPTLIGSSMGAHIALKMIEHSNPKNLILFCPAIYSSESASLPFTTEFSNAIRKLDSWKNTDIIRPLQHYTGGLLIFIGEEDKIIPPGVIELLDRHSNKVKRKKIVWLPRCQHSIHLYLPKHDEMRKSVVSEIAAFIEAL